MSYEPDFNNWLLSVDKVLRDNNGQKLDYKNEINFILPVAAGN